MGPPDSLPRVASGAGVPSCFGLSEAHRQTDTDRRRQTQTDTDRRLETQTDTDRRHRQTQTDTDRRHRHTQTDTGRHRLTQTDAD
eukprot:7314846-Alexandrium_andersonii.AAC.1